MHLDFSFGVSDDYMIGSSISKILFYKNGFIGTVCMKSGIVFFGNWFCNRWGSVKLKVNHGSAPSSALNVLWWWWHTWKLRAMTMCTSFRTQIAFENVFLSALLLSCMRLWRLRWNVISHSTVANIGSFQLNKYQSNQLRFGYPSFRLSDGYLWVGCICNLNNDSKYISAIFSWQFTRMCIYIATAKTNKKKS